LAKIRPVSTATRIIDALLGIITKTVAKKQDVQLIGFGTFKATKRAARGLR
jgi:DNA-binding protein HU-beta